MKTFNTFYTTQDDFRHFLEEHAIQDNDKLLIQVFTSNTDEHAITLLRDSIVSLLPAAALIGSTTDGEICSGAVSTGKTVVSLTQFENTTLETTMVSACTESFESGVLLAKALVGANTKAIITFTDGLHCNGEAYLNGIHTISEDIVVAGGLAGDDAQFIVTHVFTKDSICSLGAVGVALNNADLHVYSDYSFNWLSIGNEMEITKVDGNRVYTIDGLSAYDIYKKYLGEDVAKNLPAIGIEFPLIIQKEKGSIARAVIIKDDDGSLTFAGGFSVGDRVTFGYGDAEMILNHSIETQYDMSEQPVESIFVYSCMARRRFMPELIENEIEPLQQLADVAGFFTYGEFYSCDNAKVLMNQTMTILGMSESGKHIDLKLQKREKSVLNEYQKSIKALSHLLNVTTSEMAERHSELEAITENIRAKTESLNLAQEVGHFGSWEIDVRTGQSTWSEESYKIYMHDPSFQPTLETFLSRIIPEDQEKARTSMEALMDGTPKTCELRVTRGDGKIITVLLNAKMTFDEKGNPVKMVGTTLDITEQTWLRQNNRELADIIEKSSTEIYIMDRETYAYVYVNDEAVKKIGYTREEMLKMHVFDINATLSTDDTLVLQEQLMQKGIAFNRATHITKSGHRYPVQSYLQMGKYNNEDVVIIIDIDITDLVNSELKQKRQAKILEQIHDSVISTGVDGVITHWNHGATDIYGYFAQECIGQPIEMLVEGDERQQLKWIRQQAILQGEFHDNITQRTKDGRIIYTEISLSVSKDEKGDVVGITYYTQDVTQKREIEKKLEEQTKQLNFQAYHDDLTKLPNRALFDDRLQQSIASAQRHDDKFALLFLDLDNFKQINDTLGHHYGDEILRLVAKRLRTVVRVSDSLSRLGGDEFTILYQGLETSGAAAKVAQKILDVMQPAFIVDEHELHISVSIGISLYPKDSILKNDLLKYADTAMYRAKDEGRNNYQFYAADMTTLAFEKAMLERNMRGAIGKNEFVVYYQPQIDARNNKIVGMEALVRWKHPEMGMVGPDKFIPLAEETGFVKELDRFVMREAMQTVSQWYKKGLNPGTLSLNLSIKQLMSSDYLSMLERVIVETEFDVKWLELEITESQMMHDPMRSIEVLNKLHKMDIEIAIDDFGTGYSSLAYLKRLPVNTLKIDRSFIKDLPDDEEDRAISKAVIALAQSLNLTIIAEGVEKSSQVEYLLANGCYFIQGFYYSKAISKEEMEIYIRENKVLESL